MGSAITLCGIDTHQCAMTCTGCKTTSYAAILYSRPYSIKSNQWCFHIMDNEKNQLLNIEEVMQLTRKKRSTIFTHVKLNLFPAPVKTGIRSVAWRAEDVEKWIQSLNKSNNIKEETNLESVRYKEALNSLRYKWLRREFLAGRERDIAEGLNNEQELDDYIDSKIGE